MWQGKSPTRSYKWFFPQPLETVIIERITVSFAQKKKKKEIDFFFYLVFNWKKCVKHAGIKQEQSHKAEISVGRNTVLESCQKHWSELQHQYFTAVPLRRMPWRKATYAGRHKDRPVYIVSKYLRAMWDIISSDRYWWKLTNFINLLDTIMQRKDLKPSWDRDRRYWSKDNDFSWRPLL